MIKVYYMYSLTVTSVQPSFNFRPQNKQQKPVVHYSQRPNNTHPQNVFSLIWNLSSVHIDTLLPLFPPMLYNRK